MIKTLIDIYLEYWNDYLTIEKYAEHKRLTVHEAKTLIKAAKLVFIRYGYDDNGVFLKPWGFDSIKEYVEAGGKVYWKNKGYMVKKEGGCFYIIHKDSVVTLYERDYDPLDFIPV